MPKPPIIQSNLGSSRSSRLYDERENQRSSYPLLHQHNGTETGRFLQTDIRRKKYDSQHSIELQHRTRKNEIQHHDGDGPNGQSHPVSDYRFRAEGSSRNLTLSRHHDSRLPRPSPTRSSKQNRGSATIVAQTSCSWSKLDLSQLGEDNTKSETRTEVVLSMRQSNVILSPRVYDSVSTHPSSSEEELLMHNLTQTHKPPRLQQVTMGPIEGDCLSDVFLQPSETGKPRFQNRKVPPMFREERSLFLEEPPIFREEKSMFHEEPMMFREYENGLQSSTNTAQLGSSKYSKQGDIQTQRINIPAPLLKNKKTSPISRRFPGNPDQIYARPRPSINPSAKTIVAPSRRPDEFPYGKENFTSSTQNKKTRPMSSSSKKTPANDLQSLRNTSPNENCSEFAPSFLPKAESTPMLRTRLRHAKTPSTRPRSTDFTRTHYNISSASNDNPLSSLGGSITPLLRNQEKISDAIREADLEHLINQRFLAELTASKRSFVNGLRNVRNSDKEDGSDFSTDIASESKEKIPVNNARTTGNTRGTILSDYYSPDTASDTASGGSYASYRDMPPPKLLERHSDLSDSLHVSELDEPSSVDDIDPMRQEPHVLVSPRNYVNASLTGVPLNDPLSLKRPEHLQHHEIFNPSPKKQVHFRNPISVFTSISPIISLEELGLESEPESANHETQNTVLKMKGRVTNDKPTRQDSLAANHEQHVSSIHETQNTELKMHGRVKNDKPPRQDSLGANHGQHVSTIHATQITELKMHGRITNDKPPRQDSLAANHGQHKEQKNNSTHSLERGLCSMNHDQNTGLKKGQSMIDKHSREAQKSSNIEEQKRGNQRKHIKTSAQIPGPITTSILMKNPRSDPAASSKSILRGSRVYQPQQHPGHSSAHDLSDLKSVAVLRDERLQKVMEKSPPKDRKNVFLKSRNFKIWRQNVRLQKIVEDREKRRIIKAASFHALTSIAKHFFAWRTYMVKQQIDADELYCYHLMKKGMAALRWVTNTKKFKTEQAQSGRTRIKLRACFKKWEKSYNTKRLEELKETFLHWKTRCKNRMIVDLFATRRERILILQSFFFWKENFHYSLHIKMAVEHYNDTVVRKTWHLWRIFTAEKVVRNSQKEVAEIKHEGSVLSRSLERWKRTTTQIQYARMYCNKKILCAHVKKWKHFTSLAKILHRKEINMARDARRRHLVMRHFKIWSQELKMKSFRRENQHEIMRGCVTVWKSQVERHRVISAEIVSHRNFSLLKRSFVAVAHYARNQKVSRTQAVHQLEELKKRRLLIAWHNFTMRKVKLRNMQKTYYISKIKKNMQGLFIKWKFQLQAILFVQEQQRLWTVHCVRKAMNKWIRLLRMKQMKTLCKRGVVHKRRKILRGCFTTWRRQLAKEKRADDRARECGVLLVREKMRRFLRHWNIRTQESVNLRPVIERLDRKRMGRYFDAWALLRNRQIIKEDMNQQIQVNTLRRCFDIWEEKLGEVNKEKTAVDKCEKLQLKKAFKGWKKYTTRCHSYAIVSNQHEHIFLLRSFYIWATKTTFKQIQESKKIHQHFLERVNAQNVLLRWRTAAKYRMKTEEKAISRFTEQHDLLLKRSKFTLWCDMFCKYQKAKDFALENTKRRLRAILSAWHILASDSLQARTERFTSSIKSLREQQLHSNFLSKSTQSKHDITIGNDVITQTSFEEKDTHGGACNTISEKTLQKGSLEVSHVYPTGNKRVGSASGTFSNVSSISDEEVTSEVISVVTNGGADSGILLRDYVSTATSERQDDASSISSVNGSPFSLNFRTNHDAVDSNPSHDHPASKSDKKYNTTKHRLSLSDSTSTSGSVLSGEIPINSRTDSHSLSTQISDFENSNSATGGCSTPVSHAEPLKDDDIHGPSTQIVDFENSNAVTGGRSVPVDNPERLKDTDIHGLSTQVGDFEDSTGGRSAPVNNAELLKDTDIPGLSTQICDSEDSNSVTGGRSSAVSNAELLKDTDIHSISAQIADFEDSNSVTGGRSAPVSNAELLKAMSTNSCQIQTSESKRPRPPSLSSCNFGTNTQSPAILPPSVDPYFQPALQDLSHLSELPVKEVPSWRHTWTGHISLNSKEIQSSDQSSDVNMAHGTLLKIDSVATTASMQAVTVEGLSAVDWIGKTGIEDLEFAHKTESQDAERLLQTKNCDLIVTEKGTNADFKHGHKMSEFGDPVQHQVSPELISPVSSNKDALVFGSKGHSLTVGYGDSIEKAEIHSSKLVLDSDVETQGNYVGQQSLFSSTMRDTTITPVSDDNDAESLLSSSSSDDDDLLSSSSSDVTNDIIETTSLKLLKNPRPTLPIHLCVRDYTVPTTEWLVRVAVMRLRYRPLAFAFHQWKLLVHARQWRQEMISQLQERCDKSLIQRNFRFWKIRFTQLQKAKLHHVRALKRLHYHHWMTWTEHQQTKKRVKASADQRHCLTLLRKYTNTWKQRLDQKLSLLEILKYWQTKAKQNSPRVKDARLQRKQQQELMAECFFSWKLQAKQIEMAGEHRKKIIVARCFSVWSQWSSEKVSIARTCNDKHSHTLKRKTFAAWRRHILLMRVVKLKQNLVTRNWISSLLCRWHEHTQVRKHHRNAITNISASNRARTAESCFRVWKEELMKRKLSDVMHHRCLMRKFVHAWHDVTMDEIRDKEKFKHIQDLVEKHSKHQIMMIWLDQVILQSKVKSMRLHHLLALILQTFNTWKEKVAMKRAARSYSLSLKKRMLNDWKNYLQQKRYSNQKARSVLLKWHEITVRNQSLSNMADDFRSRARTLSIEITFNTWVIAHELNIKAKMHWNKKITGRSFMAWYRWSKYKKNLKKTQSNYINQRRKELFAISWHKWKFRYRIRLRNTNAIAIQKRALAFRVLKQHWFLWKQRMQEQAACKIYRDSLVNKSFLKWALLYEKLKRADQIAKQHENMRLTLILFSWVSYTLDMKTERKVLADLRDSRNKILTISTFMTWMKACKNKKIANTFRENKMKMKAFDRLREWRNEQNRLRHCYQQAVQLVQCTLLKFYFTQWKSMFRKVRMLEVTSDHIVLAKREKLMKKSWKKWFKAKEKRDLQRLRERDLVLDTVKKWRSYAAMRIQNQRIREERSVVVEKFKENWFCKRSFGKWKREYLVRQFTHKTRISLLNRSWTSWTETTSMIIYATEMDKTWRIQKCWHLWRLEFVSKRAADRAVEGVDTDLMKTIFRSWRAYTYEKHEGHRLCLAAASPRSVEGSLTPRKKSRIPILKK